MQENFIATVIKMYVHGKRITLLYTVTMISGLTLKECKTKYCIHLWSVEYLSVCSL